MGSLLLFAAAQAPFMMGGENLNIFHIRKILNVENKGSIFTLNHVQLAASKNNTYT
jgi:hypothetical protein